MLLHRLFASFLLIIAAGVTACAAAMLLSALYSRQAGEYLGDWQARGRVPSAASWNMANTASQRANRFYPVASGALLDQQALVFDWYRFVDPADDGQTGDAGQQALARYRLALAARPTWPYTWRNLAMAKLRAGERDDELYIATERALHFGPAELSVMRDVADIGLSELWRDSRFVPIAGDAAMRLSRWNRAEKKRIAQRVSANGSLLRICEELPLAFRRTQDMCPF